MIRVRRREFLTLLGGAAWPLGARAQPPTIPMIGFLNGASPDAYTPFVAAFRQGLREAGYIEGQNATIEYRWADGRYERLPALAAELIHRKVAVIAATTTPAAQAAKAATSTVPIVFTTADDPVKLGLVSSINRPGGNITGITNLLVELGSKQLGLLRDLVPDIAVTAALINPNFPGSERQLADVQAAARALGLQLAVVRASTEREIDAAFASMVQQDCRAVVVGADPFFLARRDRIVALAARDGIPAIYSFREFALAGGLMSYGTDFRDSYRLAGVYTGRIIKGEQPADLPVQRSVKFEFVLNLKTAKTLGLSVPTSMQLLADEVIE